MLSIATRLLMPGSSYRLQVDYDGGQTGILSFTYADEIVLEGYITMATGMEGMQAEIHLIPSFNRLLKIPTIRKMVLQTGPPQSLQNRLQQMAAEWIPTILKETTTCQ